MESSLLQKTGQSSIGKRTEVMGIFLILGVVCFVIALAMFIGLIFYKKSLNDGIEGMRTELKSIESDFGGSSIEGWARTAESIEIAKSALGQHRYLSNIFSFIGKNTLPAVRFSAFSYNAESNLVTLSAEARSYEALAQQKNVFEKDPSISSLAIGSFTLNTTGGVNFKLDLIFNSSVLGKQ